jgi:carbon storage regulator
MAMLVLSRKRGERIRIGDCVEVTVLAISGSRVKLGFSGPPDVWIQRDEVRRADERAGERSAPPVSSTVQAAE